MALLRISPTITDINTISTMRPKTMATQPVIEALESKIQFLEIATLMAAAAAVVFGVLLLWYRTALNSENKKQLTLLSIELEKRKQENLELYGAVSPRQISIDRLAAAMESFKGTSAVFTYLSDGEAHLTSTRLQSALAKAGWNVSHSKSFLIGGGNDGVLISPSDETTDAANALVKFLMDDSIHAELSNRRNKEDPMNAISIFVSGKPIPFVAR